MNWAELIWYRLGFPEGLSENSVTAALSGFSGLPSRTRLILITEATGTGISHRLAVTETSGETVAAGLRAAIPSLRLTPTVIPPPAKGTKLMWQLAPRLGALRVSELGPISAGLLATLFPLADKESIHLRWTVRPARRPAAPIESEDTRSGRAKALRAKLSEAGFSVYGELIIDAASTSRRRQLIARVGSALWSLSGPFGHLTAETPWAGKALYCLGQRGRYFSVSEVAAVIAWPIGDSLDLPGLTLGAAKRLVPVSALPEKGRVLGESDFAGLNRPVAISPAASTKGLYVLGPTGTGKTSLLKNLVRSDLEQGRGLAVIETNGDLVRELVDAVPKSRIQDVVLLDPTDRTHAVGFNPLASSGDPSLIADQLGELFHRLWAAFWGPRTAQLTHMGLLTLARRGGSTLLDLPRLYQDMAFRDRLLAELDDPLGLGPDWQWFEGLSPAEKNNVVSPLLNKVRAFTARPAIRAIVGQAKPALTMRQIIEGKKVLLVHLPKGLIGGETAQLLGCLVLTAVWQAAAERADLAPNRRHPFGVYVDEVQDFAASPVPWDEMSAQGRKYGLSLTMAHQNLDQLPKEMREVVLANARSKAVFALSASDARVMERLFAPALSAADLKALDPYSVAATVALDDGSTARPVTLTTPPPVKPLGSAAKVRRASRGAYARPIKEVEGELRARLSRPRKAPSAPVGRRPRRSS